MTFSAYLFVLSAVIAYQFAFQVSDKNHTAPMDALLLGHTADLHIVPVIICLAVNLNCLTAVII